MLKFYIRTLQSTLQSTNMLHWENSWIFQERLAKWFPHVEVGVEDIEFVANIYYEMLFPGKEYSSV